ncbi:MAG TPA: molybdenum cofactor guanylyltransferase [Fusobacteriaceae bacterium]|jgi:molybdopterin-guanine dinucleotide biosynthesis protein A|nr:molybdenum cofactor guanylyltransferase [Fusobacteriaceae bacterium]
MKKNIALLAGGKNSRMGGFTKSFLKFKDEYFFQRILEEFKNFNRIVIVSNEKKLYEKYKVESFEDIIKEKGPLGGIYTALLSINDSCLVVACDMPFLKQKKILSFYDYLDDYDAVIPLYKGRPQPLCSLYNISVLKYIKEAIDNNDLKIMIPLKKAKIKFIEIDDNELFVNINTPEEYRLLNI